MIGAENKSVIARCLGWVWHRKLVTFYTLMCDSNRTACVCQMYQIMCLSRINFMTSKLFLNKHDK